VPGGVLTKTCSKCGNPKILDEFHRQSRKVDGRHPWCKICCKTYGRARYAANPQAQIDKATEWRKANRDRARDSQAEWNTRNPEYHKQWYAEHAETERERSSRWSAANMPKVLAKNRRYVKARKLVDVGFRLACSLRSRLHNALRRGNADKSGSAVSDLGCTIPELKAHLESQFYSHPETGEVMTWENWSPTGWHIDHKKPLALLIKDPTNSELFFELNHFSNLQPLWAEHNLAKGDGLEWKRAA